MTDQLVVFEQQLAPLAPRLREALAGIMPVERLVRTLIISCDRNPLLLTCNRQTLLNAAWSAAVLGLEVDGVTGQAFIIPFKNKAQLVIGYKGYNTIGARSNITITGDVVREGEKFEFELGSQSYIRHRPELDQRGRRIIAAWASAAHLSRPPINVVMGIEELLAVKQRSPGAQRSDSPWNDPAIGFPAMASKTAKRRLARSLPLTAMTLAARLDEAHEEQGKYSYIDDRRELQIEGEAEALPSEPSPAPTAEELIGAAKREAPSHEVPSTGGGASLQDRARGYARQGNAVFTAFWKALSKSERSALQSIGEELRNLIDEKEGAK